MVCQLHSKPYFLLGWGTLRVDLEYLKIKDQCKQVGLRSMAEQGPTTHLQQKSALQPWVSAIKEKGKCSVAQLTCKGGWEQ